MPSVLTQAAIMLFKREVASIVAATGLIFEQLKKDSQDKPLEEVLISQKGGIWGEETVEGVGYPILRSSNMRGKRVDITDAAWCSIPSYQVEAFTLQSGDILVTKSSGSSDLVGKAAIYFDPMDGNTYLFSNFTLRLRPDKMKVNPEYLAWFLRSPQSLMWRYEKQQNAVGLRNLQTKEYLNQAIPVPDLKTQGEVVTYLNFLESKEDEANSSYLPPPLAEQRCIVKRIEALAGRLAVAQSLRREANEEANHLIKSAKSQLFSTDGNTIVKDFVDIQSGYAFKSEWFSPEGIRLVRNVNIGHGDVRWDEVARIPAERRCEFPDFELTEGDILISLDRPLISTGLKAARVRKQDLPSLLLQRVGRVNFKNKKVLPEFLFEWLHSPHFTSSIDPGRSNGIPHISPKDIELIPFSPPPLEEQRRLVAYLDGLQAQVSQLRKHQEETQKELEALMPSILDKAFKGEL